jgi:predicted alpha/beta hydrolase family esterase
MTGVLIVPGLFGSGAGHWQRIWQDERPDARIVHQADWDHPHLDAWLETLERAIEAAGETYIVAHSLGCLLTARLARRPAARRVRGALLVAPCNLAQTEMLHPGRLTFGTMPTQPLPFPSLLIGSVNDPYMSPAQIDRLKDDLEVPLHTIGAAGHINIASGYGRWREGYALFDTFRAGIEALHHGGDAVEDAQDRRLPAACRAAG